VTPELTLSCLKAHDSISIRRIGAKWRKLLRKSKNLSRKNSVSTFEYRMTNPERVRNPKLEFESTMGLVVCRRGTAAFGIRPSDFVTWISSSGCRRLVLLRELLAPVFDFGVVEDFLDDTAEQPCEGGADRGGGTEGVQMSWGALCCCSMSSFSRWARRREVGV
jgi:hypothetical protein